jgi:4-hydroxy-2-oxoheptanedioate aldolase
VSDSVKTRVQAGEQLLGVLLRMPAEELLEMCAVTGFDFVILDGEHGPMDLGLVRTHLVLAERHGMRVLVRVGTGEPASVLRILDLGADGVVGPHVDSPAQARALVDAAHYPPLGHRGFATYGRGGRFGQVSPADHLAAAREHTLVIGMIESPEGVAQVADIVTVPGLDGIMVGPADLRIASGPDDLDPAVAIDRVHEAVSVAGKVRMDIVTGTSAAIRSREDGAQLVVYNLTHTLMEHLAALRSPGGVPC